MGMLESQVKGSDLAKNFFKFDSLTFQNENNDIFVSKIYNIFMNQKIDDLNNLFSKLRI
jgi:hypothetical protein